MQSVRTKSAINEKKRGADKKFTCIFRKIVYSIVHTEQRTKAFHFHGTPFFCVHEELKRKGWRLL